MTPTALVRRKTSKDVVVYTRHVPGCKLKECGCPKWLYIKATQKRVSARTNSREAAEKEAQKIRDSYDPDKMRLAELEARHERTRITLDEAIRIWLDGKLGDDLKPQTVACNKYVMAAFSEFAHKYGVTDLRDVTQTLLTDWKNSNSKERLSTKRKKRGTLRSFFRFCVESQKWIAVGDNPATALSKVRGKDRVSAVAFSQEQYEAILAATYKYGDSLTNYDRNASKHSEVRLRTFIETMRWSGLAIVDTVLLGKSQLKDDDSLVLRRLKNDNAVIVQLPHEVAERLRNVPPAPRTHPDYFFWTGEGEKHRSTSHWNIAFKRLWKLVQWPSPLVALADTEKPGEGTGDPIKPHPHMFRHTFAFHLLSNDWSLPDVARVLGHSSIATTQKYYNNYVPGEAERLKKQMRATFEAQGAPGHKKPEPEHRMRIPIKRRSMSGR